MMAIKKARVMLLGLCLALGFSQRMQAQTAHGNVTAEQLEGLCQQISLKREQGNLAAAYTLAEDALRQWNTIPNPSLRVSFSPMAEFVYTALQIPAHQQEGEQMLQRLRTSLDGIPNDCAGSEDICVQASQMESTIGGIYSQLARNGGNHESHDRSAAIDAYRHAKRWINRETHPANLKGREEANVQLAGLQTSLGLELLLAGDFAAARAEINAALSIACASSPSAKNAQCERARKATAAVDNGAAVKALAAPPAEGPKDEE